LPIIDIFVQLMFIPLILEMYSRHFDPVVSSYPSQVNKHTCTRLTNKAPIENSTGFYIHLYLRVDVLSLVMSCPPSFSWIVNYAHLWIISRLLHAAYIVTFCPSVTYSHFFTLCFPTTCHFVPLCCFVPASTFPRMKVKTFHPPSYSWNMIALQNDNF
jgi:hypothetical protein